MVRLEAAGLRYTGRVWVRRVGTLHLNLPMQRIDFRPAQATATCCCRCCVLPCLPLLNVPRYTAPYAALPSRCSYACPLFFFLTACRERWAHVSVTRVRPQAHANLWACGARIGESRAPEALCGGQAGLSAVCALATSSAGGGGFIVAKIFCRSSHRVTIHASSSMSPKRRLLCNFHRHQFCQPSRLNPAVAAT